MLTNYVKYDKMLLHQNLGGLLMLPKKQWLRERLLEMDKSQMEQIELAIQHGLRKGQVEYLANTSFSGKQMELIRLAFEHEWEEEQIKFLLKDKFTDEQMELIHLAIKHGWKERQVKFIAECICKWIGDIEQLNKKYNSMRDDEYYRLEELRDINSEIHYIKDDLCSVCSELKVAIKQGLSVGQIEFMLKFGPIKMKQIRLAFKDGLSKEQVEFIYTYDLIKVGANDECCINNFKTIKLAFEEGLSKDEILKLVNNGTLKAYLKITS